MLILLKIHNKQHNILVIIDTYHATLYKHFLDYHKYVIYIMVLNSTTTKFNLFSIIIYIICNCNKVICKQNYAYR